MTTSPVGFAAAHGSAPLGEITPRAESGILGVGGVRKYCANGLTLIHANCMDWLHLFADAEALISDPPWGIKLNTRNASRGNTPPHSKRVVAARNWQKIEGDDRPFDPSPWLRFPRVVLWGASAYCDRLPGGMKWLVWDKREGVMQNDNSDCELAWTNQRGVLRMHRQLWGGLLRRGEENGDASTHPTQKPIALMAWCMEQVKVPAGAMVADPFMGSGGTAIACLRTGRQFIGFETDAEHYDTAVARIEKELSHADFFTGGGGGFSVEPSAAEKEPNAESSDRL